MSAFDTLERQLHDAASRRRRRPALLLVPALIVAAIAALLVVNGGGSGTVPADEKEAVATLMPAATPAFVTVDSNKIVYVHATTVAIDHTNGGDRKPTSVTEEWHRGRETHRLVTGTNADGSSFSLDHVIEADGTMHQVNEEGTYRVIRGSDANDAAKDAANVIADEQAGFLESFRNRYEPGSLDPSGDVTFAGKPAYRYHIAADANRSPDQSYYIDRTNGEPLGFTSTLDLDPSSSVTATQTVDTIEFLDPTPENLAKLRTLTLKRRN
jgi:hypothetical protein